MAKIWKLQWEFQWFISLSFPVPCVVIIFVCSPSSLQLLRLEQGENIDGSKIKLWHIIKVKVVLLSMTCLGLQEALTLSYNAGHWLCLWTCGWKLSSLFCFILAGGRAAGADEGYGGTPSIWVIWNKLFCSSYVSYSKYSIGIKKNDIYYLYSLLRKENYCLC